MTAYDRSIDLAMAELYASSSPREIRVVAREFRVNASTLTRRFNGSLSRTEAYAYEQRLSAS
jgi:hypothetical protein